jgi:Homeodomain-like domain
MRPPSVYAKRSCPAGDPCDLLRLLHGPHRIGLRLVMILLSQQGWTAVTIAELLGCDPRTVRRWVHATTPTVRTRWPTGPDPAGHAWVAGG